MVLIQNEVLTCPNCGSEDLKRFPKDKQNREGAKCNSCQKRFFINHNPRCIFCNGYTIKRSVQCGIKRYRCKSCGRDFGFGTREYTPKRSIKRRKPKPKFDFPSLAPLFRQPINADVDIPCFCCGDQNSMECNPNTCKKLSRFINGEIKKND